MAPTSEREAPSGDDAPATEPRTIADFEGVAADLNGYEVPYSILLQSHERHPGKLALETTTRRGPAMCVDQTTVLLDESDLLDLIDVIASARSDYWEIGKDPE